MKTILLIIFLTLSCPVLANGGPKVQPWPLESSKILEKYQYKSQMEFAKAIFLYTPDIDLYDVENGPVGQRSFRVRRAVYQNNNLDNTLTVKDIFQVPLVQKLELDNEHEIGHGFYFGVRAGFYNGLEVTNITQINPDQLWRIPTISELIKNTTKIIKTKESEVLEFIQNLYNTHQNYVQKIKNDESSKKLGKVYQYLLSDPLEQTLLGKYWDLITVPLKIPYNRFVYDQLKNGEITSYAYHGTAEVGVGAGWHLSVAGIDELIDLGYNIKLFLHGKFRISVFKQSANKALIKLTKVREQGAFNSFGFYKRSTVFVKGFAILGKDYDLKTQFIPFNFSMDSSKQDIFDIAYEYDLDSAEGYSAFRHALVGRFGQSEALSTHVGENNLPIVKKVLTRETESYNERRSKFIRLSLFFRRLRSSTSSIKKIKLITPEGEEQILKNTTINGDIWRFRPSLYEKRFYHFKHSRVNSNLDQPTEENGLSIEGVIQDRSTTSTELWQYLNEIESALAGQVTFPKPPIYRAFESHELKRFKALKSGAWKHNAYYRRGPGLNTYSKKLKAHYGVSTFRYRLDFSDEQVQKFINIPDDERWRLLEIAFNKKPGTWSSHLKRVQYGIMMAPLSLLNIPLNIIEKHNRYGSDLYHAKNLHMKWKQLVTKSDNLSSATEHGRFYQSQRYSHEIIRLLIASLNGEIVKYEYSIFNQGIGELAGKGYLTCTDQLSNHTRFSKSNIQVLQEFFPFDDSANIHNINFYQNDKLENILAFETQRKPKFITLHASSTKNFKKLRLVIPTKKFLKAGLNELNISDQENSLAIALKEALEPGKEAHIKIGISYDGVRFGKLYKFKFLYPGEIKND